MSKAAMGTNNLDAFWMPFTANRQFKQDPRLLVSAKDMHFKSHDGREILDGTAGLWCCNAGHARPKIVEAVQKQVAELDYAPAFQMGHPKVFELAARLAAMLPSPIDHVFFTNSGSEAVDTALKIAIAYHRAKGNGTKVKLIGRERGYHGVGFGGISVGGISGNRKTFGNALGGIDHIRHTHDPARNAFTRGEPEYGVEFADDLERVIALHDASNIAAVIVEPVAGSTGVLIPPKGYLKRLREICTKHDILLIFDEVITGFGRLGAPFAVDYFGVIPDLVTTAKGITSGVIPMGAVFATRQIYEAFMTGPENMIELFHGYTYSGHPVACAAALATLDTYEDEGLMTRAADLADYWADALHALKGLPHVVDIRNLGLIGAVELEPIDGAPTKRAFQAFLDSYEKGLLIRTTGDIIALSPPLIISKGQIEHLFDTLADVLKNLA
ncbi:beta-alanine--pyruvate transaminase [Phyllobacterium sp. YR620]|uniref:Aspartate aminotransferase family protein n=1 Tax=Phyllobacterium pellucidum TaxID=2740464 RepID=A0A849VS87_9HYPH|nr:MULTISPECIES: aspartate aminotransferase family protein [Phyllobacterium]NTS32865.1 aspartate aminotransferase family protein [Phyllobacterium pellucidum]UGY10240.1 aspartate aminotransferase family protein [Phyllobacterium sp. T1018]SDP33433.1 beta-alanine--pyruvate transaminase [Phyllobacterium sp. YR620]